MYIHTALADKLASELLVSVEHVHAAIALLESGASVAFIATYRQEATNGLTEEQLNALQRGLMDWRALDVRRQAILSHLRELQQLTPALAEAIECADSKMRLEDLYLPYRPKRRSKAGSAQEAGLGPLADALLADASVLPEVHAGAFVNPAVGIMNVAAALEGARHILMERFAEVPALLDQFRTNIWEHGVLKAHALKAKQSVLAKHRHVMQAVERLNAISAPFARALWRARRDQAIQLHVEVPLAVSDGCEVAIATAFGMHDTTQVAIPWLMDTVRQTWKIKLFPALELELLARLRELAGTDALFHVSRQLRGALLAAPAGQRATLGLFPVTRAGIAVAVVDALGQPLDDFMVFPFPPDSARELTLISLAQCIAKHHVELVSIAKQPARTRDALVQLIADFNQRYPDMPVLAVPVSDIGVAGYAVAGLAMQELPQLEVTSREAVSMARRLQDPLSELAKLEPQDVVAGLDDMHEVGSARLMRCVQETLEAGVNAVGVDVNCAPVAVLRYVSGLNVALAAEIVAYREAHGAFRNREQLKRIPSMSAFIFQQAAGFLRVVDGDEPLDNTAVHPEAYAFVMRVLAQHQWQVEEVLRHPACLEGLNPAEYTDTEFGLRRVQSVFSALKQARVSTRAAFNAATRHTRVKSIQGLRLGMVLDGTVGNMTHFGAFVDVGVHQDGLIHVSSMPRNGSAKALKTGDRVRVKVTTLDLNRRRIGLSLDHHEVDSNLSAVVHKPHKPVDAAARRATPKTKPTVKAPSQSTLKHGVNAPFNTVMADALAKLKGEVS